MRWINVKDGLPDNNEFVLIYIKEGKFEVFNRFEIGRFCKKSKHFSTAISVYPRHVKEDVEFWCRLENPNSFIYDEDGYVHALEDMIDYMQSALDLIKSK